VIGEKGVCITPGVMASGGGVDGGSAGTLLLLNLFRERLNMRASNGEKVTR
jgi:hypothetical protein